MINNAATVGVPAPRLTGTGAIVRPVLTGPQLRSLIARDLLDVLSAEPARLRECDSDVCRMIYRDTPGGRARKWCSMRLCGNQAKAAQHRHKVGSWGRSSVE